MYDGVFQHVILFDHLSSDHFCYLLEEGSRDEVVVGARDLVWTGLPRGEADAFLENRRVLA
jgi:hypothetical protein